MANTREELRRIHTRKLATPNRKYYRDDGVIFFGTSNGRLKIYEDSDRTNFESTSTIESNNIQDALVEVDEELRTQITEEVSDLETSIDESFIRYFLFLGS